MIKALTPKQKVQKLMTDIGGGWYLEKIAKGLPPLKRSKLSKKAQEKEDKIQKYIYESNRWWDDWIFQLHQNNLEWVNPKTLIKRDKPYSVSSKTFYSNKNDKTSHWVGHYKLKELDIIDFFERKHMI